jgi:hypothetical protein
MLCKYPLRHHQRRRMARHSHGMLTRRKVVSGLAVGSLWLSGPRSAAGGRDPIDVGSFGFQPSPANNRTAQEAMRRHAIANPGSVYRFSTGTTYDLTTPRFLFGVRDIEIIASGASFRNSSAGTFAYSDLNAAFYMGSGSIFHPMGGGNIVPKQATSGERIHDAAAGDRAVRLVDAAKAAEFAPDTWALLHWFSRQRNSFPPNPGYFEYVKVRTANVATGVLQLDRPLSYSYKATAPDDRADPKLYGTATGPARILSLERPDYRICERFVLRGGRGLTGFRKTRLDPFDGGIEVCGVIEAELHDVDFEGFWPSMARTVSVYGGRFSGGSELDKIIERINLDDCSLTDMTQGTGVHQLRMRGGQLRSSGRPDRTTQIRARHITLQGVEVHSQNEPHQYPGGSQVSMDAYAKSLIDIDRCTFYPDARQGSAIGPGDGVIFVPDAVSRHRMMIAHDNPAMAEIRAAIDGGATILLAEGTVQQAFTVADIRFDASDNLVLDGSHDVAEPADRRLQRRLPSVRRFIDRGNNRIVAPPPRYQLLPTTHAIAELRQAATDGPRRFTFSLRAPQSYAPPIQGRMAELTIDVVRPYTGSDKVAVLDIAHYEAGPYDFGSIDVTVPGTRTMDHRQTTGAQGADRWTTPFPKGLWVELLTLHLHGSGRAAFADGDRSGDVFITVSVATSNDAGR